MSTTTMTQAVSTVAVAAAPTSTIFFPVRSTKSSKYLNAPVDEVLSFLHNEKSVINLDPLVSTCTLSTTQTGLWSVVDRIKLVKLPSWLQWSWPSKLLNLAVPVKYTADFHPTPNGVVIDVVANRLLSMRNTWRVTGTKGGTEVFMEVQSRVFVLLMPFVSGPIKKNHDTMLNGLIEKFESKAGHNGWSSKS